MPAGEWDQIRRTQLSDTINLMTGLGAGALAYVASLLLGDKFLAYSEGERILVVLAFLLLGLQLALALVATVSRLVDFRNEAQKARGRAVCVSTDTLGNITWGAFWCQLSAFAVAILLLATAILQIA